MTVLTQSNKLVNIDRFDTIEIDDCSIYALNDKREVVLGKYNDEKKAREALFDLSEHIGTSKIYEMKK